MRDWMCMVHALAERRCGGVACTRMLRSTPVHGAAWCVQVEPASQRAAQLQSNPNCWPHRHHTIKPKRHHMCAICSSSSHHLLATLSRSHMTSIISQIPHCSHTLPLFSHLATCCHIRTAGGKKTVLAGVWGCARPREMHALIGPSGAGKSTLMDILAQVPYLHVIYSLRLHWCGYQL